MAPVYTKRNAIKRRERLGARKGHPGTRRAKPTPIDRRLTAKAQWQGPDRAPVYHDADTPRLAKRLRKHSDHIFTFLDKPEVPFENNFAERMIRPAVILRKNSQSDRSKQGAATQAILMSICRTLRMRGHGSYQDRRCRSEDLPRSQPTTSTTRLVRRRRLKWYAKY